MKRIVLVLLLAASAAGYALDVVRGELESAKDKNVVFVSYEGPPSKVESLAAIKGIGSSLGAAARSDSLRSGLESRYAVIRVVDPAVKTGFDADIIVLGADAQVDHIRNLRWIIAAYLSSAWGYSDSDAALLANFVTVYNAVYRGDLGYFGSKYKPAVMRELTADNAGLSTRYTDWPGRTRILIPLTEGATPGSLGAVSTGAVSDKGVKESLQAEPGKAIPDRQGLTDLKEREAAQKQAEVDAQKAAIAKQEADLAAEKARVEAERARLEADKAAAAAAAPGPARAPGTAPAAGSPGAGQSAELTQREATVAQAEKAVAGKEAAVAAAKEEVKQGEAAVAAKKEEAAADRTAITQDQKKVIAAEVAAKGKAEKAGVFFFKVVEDSYHLAQILYVDAEGGSLIRSSRINSLHPRSIVDSGEAFVAIAGRDGAPGGVKLMKLDKTSLEDVADGQSEMFADSPVWKLGEALFAVAKGDGGSYFLARFGADLKETARSKAAVNPYTALVEGGGGIIVQTPAGSLAVLSAETLQTVKELKP